MWFTAELMFKNADQDDHVFLKLDICRKSACLPDLFQSAQEATDFAQSVMNGIDWELWFARHIVCSLHIYVNEKQNLRYQLSCQDYFLNNYGPGCTFSIIDNS